jgi:hypothetical protein
MPHRPRRTYHQLTDHGRQAALHELTQPETAPASARRRSADTPRPHRDARAAGGPSGPTTATGVSPFTS